MSTLKPDLRSLARAPVHASHPISPAAGPIPRPRARWRTRVLVPFVVIAAAGGILAYAARDALSPRVDVFVAAAIPKAQMVEAGTSESTPEPPGDAQGRSDHLGPVIVQAPGWVEPAPYAVSVPALAEGVVREVLYLEGEHVEANQVVARLIDDDASLQVRFAEAAIAERASDVERARTAGATAESQIRVEQAVLAEARDEVTRKRELVDIGGVSAGDFRRLEIRLGGVEAKVAMAERTADEARAAIRQAEAAAFAAAVLLDEAKLRLSRMEIRSPIAGVVLARLVEPGSRISMGSRGGEGGGASMSGAVLRLYDPTHLQVRVDVPLADAAKVGVGTRAIVTTEALPDQTFTGVIARVVHEANIQRNTVQFKVALDAPSPVLKPEMLTRVKLHATPSSSGTTARTAQADGSGADASDSSTGLSLLIPASAVADGGKGKGAVWLVDASSGRAVARRREIVTEPSSEEGFVTVIEGLRLTDRVVLDAPATLRDGTRLNVLGERTTAPTP